MRMGFEPINPTLKGWWLYHFVQRTIFYLLNGWRENRTPASIGLQPIALPTELSIHNGSSRNRTYHAMLFRHTLYQLSYWPVLEQIGLEPMTPWASTKCYYQLSYCSILLPAEFESAPADWRSAVLTTSLWEHISNFFQNDKGVGQIRTDETK